MSFTTVANSPVVPQQLNGFDRLVRQLRDALGPSSGIDSEDVDRTMLESLMENYVSNEQHWREYALGDISRHYTRNLIDRGNGKSNLLILVWSPGQGSPIHDHASAHCIMKVLKGTLNETIYAAPDYTRLEKGLSAPPIPKKVSTYRENEVTYISDQIGLHTVSNPDPNNFAVSLHLYTPPFAEWNGCHIFDRFTGKKSHIKICNFYSELGHKL